MKGSGAESCGLYSLSHMFSPQEYTLVNIKVVSSLVPERIFLLKKSYLFQLLKKPPNGRIQSEILRFIFCPHMFGPQE